MRYFYILATLLSLVSFVFSAPATSTETIENPCDAAIAELLETVTAAEAFADQNKDSGLPQYMEAFTRDAKIIEALVKKNIEVCKNPSNKPVDGAALDQREIKVREADTIFIRYFTIIRNYQFKFPETKSNDFVTYLFEITDLFGELESYL